MKAISFSELLELYEEKPFIPYAQYLRTSEWLQRRDQIVIRDNYTCQICHKQATMKHYDESLKQYFHLWFGENEWIKVESGVEIAMPKVTFSPKPYHLEVHHKHYIENQLPWNYINDDLTTLCNWCHSEYHQNNIVQLYTKDKLHTISLDVCKRCNGTDCFRQFNHVNNGLYLKCNGKKFAQVLIKRS